MIVEPLLQKLPKSFTNIWLARSCDVCCPMYSEKEEMFQSSAVDLSALQVKSISCNKRGDGCIAAFVDSEQHSLRDGLLFIPSPVRDEIISNGYCCWLLFFSRDRLLIIPVASSRWDKRCFSTLQKVMIGDTLFVNRWGPLFCYWVFLIIDCVTQTLFSFPFPYFWCKGITTISVSARAHIFLWQF